jgi:hypothetical protein
MQLIAQIIQTASQSKVGQNRYISREGISGFHRIQISNPKQ